MISVIQISCITIVIITILVVAILEYFKRCNCTVKPRNAGSENEVRKRWRPNTVNVSSGVGWTCGSYICYCCWHGNEKELFSITKKRLHKFTKECKAIDEEKCMICLDDIADSSKRLILSCDHVFHNTCIVTWFKQTQKCPLCWQEVKVDTIFENKKTEVDCSVVFLDD